mgnify:CR=1 FL=1
MRYFVTSTLGVEEVVADELREFSVFNVEVDVGKVFFDASLDFIYVGNFMLKTINRLFILLLREKFKDLNDIEKLASSIDYSEFIKKESSFAVRAERLGEHNFTSIDVARVVGSGVIKSYLESTGTRLKVNLENPDVEIHALVRNDELIMGINTSGDSLHRRRYRVYDHPAALKTTLASVLVRLTGYDGSRYFMDPMCGGGTIVIEALHKARRYPTVLFRQDFAYRKLKIYDRSREEEVLLKALSDIRLSNELAYCIDVSSKHIEGAKLNALFGGVHDSIKFIVGDSTLTRTYKDVDISNVKHIALNPPYGMRFHNPRKIPMFYRDFLRVIKELFGGSYLSLITAAHKAMDKAVRDVGIEVIKSFWVTHGGLLAKIYLLKL